MKGLLQNYLASHNICLVRIITISNKSALFNWKTAKFVRKYNPPGSFLQHIYLLSTPPTCGLK